MKRKRSMWWVYAGLCIFGVAIGMMEHSLAYGDWGLRLNGLLLSTGAYILARQWEAETDE